MISLHVPNQDQMTGENSSGFQMVGMVAAVDDDEDVREVLGLLPETAGRTVPVSFG